MQMQQRKSLGDHHWMDISGRHSLFYARRFEADTIHRQAIMPKNKHTWPLAELLAIIGRQFRKIVEVPHRTIPYAAGFVT